MKSFKIISFLFSFVMLTVFSGFAFSGIGIPVEASPLVGIVGAISSMALPTGVLSTTCGILASSLAKNCQNNIAGVEAEIILMNRSDIASYTVDANNSNIVTAITLKTTSPATVAYTFTVLNKRINKPKFELVKKAYRSEYKHLIDSVITDCSPEAYKWLQDLDDANLVAIVKNVYDNTTNTTNPSASLYQIYGLDQGLELMSAVGENTNADGNGLAFQLASHDEATEPMMPRFFYVTDKAQTAAAILALQS